MHTVMWSAAQQDTAAAASPWLQVLLLPPREELQRRVQARWAQGSHFMPPSLLDSQLNALMVGGVPTPDPDPSFRQYCWLA